MSDDPAFKIKTGNLPVLLLHIASVDVEQIKNQLELRLSQTPDFFSNTPIVLELSAIADSDGSLNFPELLSFMQSLGMCAAGAVGGSVSQREAAAKAGLGLFPELLTRGAQKKAEEDNVVLVAQIQTELPGFEPQVSAQSIASNNKDAGKQTMLSVVARPTVVIDKPVRTGQRIYAEGANLVVLDNVNAGAELIADGDIHIYASMRGKAIAGAQGNEGARIFVQGLEAELLSIAGCFKVFEEGVPLEVRGKPAHIHLSGTRLLIEPLSR